ncbi:LSM domain-containing protein [Daldinia bambusicola]|nr:LSM domain-containing protein [Daldinia bambusicola]
MSFVPINPRPMLQDLVNKDIVVRLKWGETEYHGRLVSSDSYMNIQLTNAQEYIDQQFTSDLGQILIRCNNVLWIKAADNKGESGGDVKMGG